MDVTFDRLWARIKTPLFYGVLIGWTAVAVAPFWFSVVYSLMPMKNIYDPPRLWPHPFSLENYRVVLSEFDLFPRWLLNSLLVAVALTVARVLFCAMAGYALARIRFPGRQALFLGTLITMMVPGLVTLIPNYLIIGPKGFHLLDSLWGVILPGITIPFGVFMMTQFYRSIPRELEEAAMIDGASRLGIFFRVILPISSNALIALAVLSFQGAWNDFLWPLVVLQTPEHFTLPLGLQWFKNEYYTLYSRVLAGSMFNSVPIILIFFVFQRYFMRGIAVTGLKGT